MSSLKMQRFSDEAQRIAAQIFELRVAGHKDGREFSSNYMEQDAERRKAESLFSDVKNELARLAKLNPVTIAEGDKIERIMQHGKQIIQALDDALNEINRIDLTSTKKDKIKEAMKHGRRIIENLCNALAGEAVDHTSPSAPNVQEQKPRKAAGKRKEISVKDAAKLCGMSPSTIEKWENGKRKKPEDYPGREDAVSFRQWAERYKSRKAMVATAKGMERAAPTDPKILENTAKDSAWEEC